jgi:hypothetical protein
MSGVGHQIARRGLVFMYDMGDPKSFIGAPTVNYMNTWYPRRDKEYSSYIATGTGEWQNNHPDAITVYSLKTGGGITGFVNTGVGDYANTDHCVWHYDTELKEPVVIMRNYDGGQWKAFNGDHSLNLAAIGLSTGDYYTYSMDLWTTHINHRPNPGLYSKNTADQTAFHDGLGGTVADMQPLVVGEWHRRWCSFQIASEHDLNKAYARFYWYGYNYQNNEIMKIRRPQLELGTNVASPWTLEPRTSTDALLDTMGGSEITAQSLTYANNNTFTFRYSNQDYIQIADTINNGASYPTDFATDYFSIEIWHYCATGDRWYDDVTFGSNGGTPIVARGDYAGAHGLWRNSTDNEIKFTLRTDVGQYNGTVSSLARDTWHHIVGVWDGTNNKIYHNGVYIAQGTPTWTSSVCDTGVWRVGGNRALSGTNGGYLDGDIPVVRIYNRPLNADEVARNFNAQRARFGL